MLQLSSWQQSYSRVEPIPIFSEKSPKSSSRQIASTNLAACRRGEDVRIKLLKSWKGHRASPERHRQQLGSDPRGFRENLYFPIFRIDAAQAGWPLPWTRSCGKTPQDASSGSLFKARRWPAEWSSSTPSAQSSAVPGSTSPRTPSLDSLIHYHRSGSMASRPLKRASLSATGRCG